MAFDRVPYVVLVGSCRLDVRAYERWKKSASRFWQKISLSSRFFTCAVA